MMQQQGFFTPLLKQMRAGVELISALDVDLMTPEALLFQTGYLTIHKSNLTLSGNVNYTLGYPNQALTKASLPCQHELSYKIMIFSKATYAEEAIRLPVQIKQRWFLLPCWLVQPIP